MILNRDPMGKIMLKLSEEYNNGKLSVNSEKTSYPCIGNNSRNSDFEDNQAIFFDVEMSLKMFQIKCRQIYR